MEAGKSTLVGVLTHGEMDNGRGRSRLNLFRHLHEIQSGHTSSISHEILGFSSGGQVGSCLACSDRQDGRTDRQDGRTDRQSFTIVTPFHPGHKLF